MIGLSKLSSPPRHAVYHDNLSLLMHFVMCVLAFLYICHHFISKFSSCYVQIHQLIHQSYLPGSILPEPSGLACLDTLLSFMPGAPLVTFMGLSSPPSWAENTFLDPESFPSCFCRALLLVESWKRVPICKSLQPTLMLDWEFCSIYNYLLEKIFSWNIVDTAPLSCCCQKSCWEVQSYYDSCFLSGGLKFPF